MRLTSLRRYVVSLLLIVPIGFGAVFLTEVVSADSVNSQEVIGKVITARGVVNAIGIDGTIRKLKRKASVWRGDTITTGTRSSVLMKLKDKSKFELSADASMQFTDFVYKESADDKVVANVTVGVFRFVTGLVAKENPESMKIRTGISTIGVRGTHVLGEVKGESVRVILLEPEDGVARETAIDVGNDVGTVLIDKQGWGTYIADANTAPTAPRRMRLRTIQNLMGTMQSIQRMPRVRPRF